MFLNIAFPSVCLHLVSELHAAYHYACPPKSSHAENPKTDLMLPKKGSHMTELKMSRKLNEGGDVQATACELHLIGAELPRQGRVQGSAIWDALPHVMREYSHCMRVEKASSCMILSARSLSGT